MTARGRGIRPRPFPVVPAAPRITEVAAIPKDLRSLVDSGLIVPCTDEAAHGDAVDPRRSDSDSVSERPERPRIVVSRPHTGDFRVIAMARRVPDALSGGRSEPARPL